MSSHNDSPRIKSELEESTAQDRGPCSSTTTYIPFVNISDTKALTKCEIGEKLYIKEEIIRHQEINPEEEQSLPFERILLDEKFVMTEISSDENSCAKTLIVYDIDSTLDIKQESIQDQGTAVQKCYRKYETKLCTVKKKGVDNLAIINNLRTHKKRKMRESKYEHKTNRKSDLSKHTTPSSFHTEKTRHYCDKCPRSYTLPISLYKHKQVEHAAVKLHFTCDFCEYRTNLKRSLSRHITLRHLQTSKTRHYCDICSRSYNRLDNLNRHNRVEHEGTKSEFICDFCGYKTKMKSHLSQHIASCHLQTPETRHYCDKCSRSYNRLDNLNRHKRFEHAAVKPEFICDFCGYKTNMKSHLSQHISSCHLQTPETRHYCDKCSRSYNRLDNLNYHKRTEHAIVDPQFTRDYRGLETKQKGISSKHTTSSHSPTQKTRHYCNKCSRSYKLLGSLNNHKLIEHAAVKPQFICDYCEYKTNMKSHLSKHITSRHLHTPRTRHNCDKCSRSYSRLYTLNQHKRVKHAADRP